MPNFQISLLDTNNDVALQVVGAALQISDYSNYIASTETGNQLSDFYYKRIEVSKYGSLTPYLFQTIAGGDELIAEPNTYIATPVATNYTYDSDGVYKVVLISVPRYNPKTMYQDGHCVILSGKAYESLIDNNVDNPIVSTSWSLITSYDDIPSKYRTVQYIAITEDLRTCLADLAYQANCVELSAECNETELCSNKTWLAAARMNMILDNIQTLMDSQDYGKVSEMINYGLTLCSCCNE